ncbi:armadillo-type protein [Naematelia encephala]|uniref:Armadillo-type protein n=1 Tax=Naematelia encephala TaxID=71784 RepID=A0A1Y2ARY1_9TREE|nr:armadillo-type protein [Naematelia encephala]
MNGGPSDIRSLLHAIINPTSNAAYVRDQAQLANLFKEPEFLLALQGLSLDRSLSQPERLLCSVITGRELKTKWRSKQIVPEGRKPEVRERLFSFLEEEDLGIARPQLALLVAVARIELPSKFPNLPQLLLNPLMTCLSHLNEPSASSSSTSTVLVNTLWTINALVKEWRSVKISSGAQVMKTLEDVFLAPVGRVLEIWSERERHGEGDWVIGEAGRYAFKILARFSAWHWSKAKGLQSEAAIQHITVLLQHSVHHAPVIQAHRLRVISQYSGDPPQTESKLLHSLYKHLRAIGKWWRLMIGLDPKAWCNLDGATAGVGWWWGEVGGVIAGGGGTVEDDDSDNNPYPKRFLLLGMLLFKDILPILAADHPDIFNPSFVLSALHLLIDKLLPLTSSDLEALEDDPEEWLIVDTIDSDEAWAYEFRPCAERVLIALANATRNFPQEGKVIEPEMLKIVAEAQALPPTDLPAILRREAIYCAMGRLSRAMSSYGGIDFDAFLKGSSEWIRTGVPLHRILKRRLAWLIGQWVTSDEECAKLPVVWEILVYLLQERGEASDLAVNITAAIAIREAVDLWELDVSYFKPYIKDTAQPLIQLIGECHTLRGKRFVNQAMGVVIERTQDDMLPFLPSLAQSIPILWHGSAGLEGEWLFKASLVELTSKIIIAAKTSSGKLMELAIPLIEESMRPPANAYFEEDGVALWQSSLYNAVSLYEPTRETGLISIFPGLLGVLADNMDTIKTMLTIYDSYLLLDAPGICQTYGSAMCSTLAKALTTSKPNSDNTKRILISLSLLIRVAPLGPLALLLLDSGIFQFILAALEDDKASGLILAAYLDLLARIALLDPQIFLQMVSETARRQGRDESKVLEEVLDALWRNFDYVGEARMRKVVAMGAARLLTTGNPHILDRLDGEFMNIFLDVLGELQSTDDGGSGTEMTPISWREANSLALADIEGTAEEGRRDALENSDIAYSVPLKGFIISALTEAQAVGLGPYWDKADEGTKRSLERFLS